MSNGNQFEMVVLGDSIQWGQGLLEEWKFSELVRQTIERELGRPAILIHRFAHSGAVLSPVLHEPAANNFDPGTLMGELPSSIPSINAQLTALLNDPTINRNDIGLVLVDGGINDVRVGNIINPLTDDNDLRTWATDACNVAMLALLRRITDQTTGFPNAMVVVTSYFPIFSLLSSLPLTVPWLLGLGILIPPSLLVERTLITRLAILSELWEKTSSLALRGAVDTRNNELNQRRIGYAHVPFGPENCLFAPDSWLFGLRQDLAPEDPVAQERAQLCVANGGANNPVCLWASVGHPNRFGSLQYSRAIIRTLRELGVLLPAGPLDTICNWAIQLELQCVQWEEDRRTECTATADQGWNDCQQWEDQGWNECGNWDPRLQWLCNSWVWVSNMVCVSWVWVSNIVCVAWTEVVSRACRLFTWVITRVSCW